MKDTPHKTLLSDNIGVTIGFSVTSLPVLLNLKAQEIQRYNLQHFVSFSTEQMETAATKRSQLLFNIKPTKFVANSAQNSIQC